MNNLKELNPISNDLQETSEDPIFDYICTATGTTGIGDESSYHVADFG
jgi:hypothetical protein